MKTSMHRYAVIMAGGTGTRLWPLSRKGNPKQFHALVSDKTLLEETFARLVGIVPTENIFISTTEQYQKIVLQMLPEVTPERLIIEPSPRGTAPAITLIAQVIRDIDPQAIVATLPSDHAIEENSAFAESLSIAFESAERFPDKITTVGINPTFPSTEFGYIHMGSELATLGEKRVFLVDAFKEKPDVKTAKKYLADWAYLWNAGYFIFSAETFLTEAGALMPAIAEGVKHYCASKETGQAKNALYDSTPNEALDYALIEKLTADKRVVVPSEMGWDDIGTWDALFEFLKKSNPERLLVQENHIDLDSKNCFVHSNGRLIATLGLKDTVIVDTEDALLVAHKDRAKEVKKILEVLKEQGKQNYL